MSQQKFMRFEAKGQTLKGIVEGETVSLIEGCMLGEWKKTGELLSLAAVEKYLPPIENPSKVLGIGLNYRDHAEEGGHPIPEEPIMFFISQTALTGHKCPIIYPAVSKLVEYEVELAVVIGKTAKKVPIESALDYVFGYTISNDFSARDIQRRDKQWSRGKSFDTFKPMGPWIVTGIKPEGHDIGVIHNGEKTQKSNTSNFIFDVPKIISVISMTMALLPGDIILTGTPGGVRAIKPGDKIESYIDGIGVLENTVIAE